MFEKENHLNQTSTFGFHLNFQGCTKNVWETIWVHIPNIGSWCMGNLRQALAVCWKWKWCWCPYFHEFVCFFCCTLCKGKVGVFLEDILIEVLDNLTRPSIDVWIVFHQRCFYFTVRQTEVAPTCNLTKQLIFVDSPCATDYVRLGNDKFHPSLLYRLKGPPVLHEAMFGRMLCILPWSFFVDYLCILPQQSLCVGVLLQNQVAHDEKKTAKPRKVSAGSLVLVQEIKDIIIEWGWLLAQLANGNASQDSGKTSKWNAMMDIPTNHSDTVIYTCHDLWPQLMTKNAYLVFFWGGELQPKTAAKDL